ncbi:hypothetical protein FH972_013015 [Carpinus fangiana]|uniref:Uncharacterized protein n=1 Tax=Carpinus fangiana TaxID=176857 RepID=A0A5N6R7V8_9ROSI|nr:hypothetical protein FH972_013015 [Carpinus fangiana]
MAAIQSRFLGRHHSLLADQYPPVTAKGWNDGNCWLHILHLKTRLGELEKSSISAPRESSIKQFAMVLMLSSSLPVMLLFMVRVKI